MEPSIWIDVEDLFDYARDNPRPSGIQRLTFEIYAALVERHGASGRVRFLRHDPETGFFRPVSWSSVKDVFGTLSQSAPPCRPPPPLVVDTMASRMTASLPDPVGAPLHRFLTLQGAVFQTIAGLFRGTSGAGTDETASPPVPCPAPDRFAPVPLPIHPGDALMVLGAAWFHPGYGEILRRAREELGMRVSLLVHDLIPLRRPEWCDPGLVARFGAWFDGVLPQCDRIHAVSRATARDVETHAASRGLALPGPVRTVPLGTGFSLAAGPRDAGAAREETGLPPGGYVLFVSTIEARKNHVLLFRVWRRLLAELPASRVPGLVFAGRIGWLAADLMAQIENTRYLNGKLHIVEDPTDAVLRTLYADCLFTVFPSLYEGWGLPVTESLALGKPCVISNATSLPEAGGALVRSFDPDDVGDACRVLRATIEDRDGLAAWEARVRREFRPVPWSATADALVEGIGPARQPVRAVASSLAGRS